MNYLILILSVVVSYLMGGVNGAIVISKLVYHEDIREKGSHNPGFTNFKRVYGMHISTVFAISIDVFKTIIPVLCFSILFKAQYELMGFESPLVAWQIGSMLSGLFCMLGHVFPIYYNFKGGKAVLSFVSLIWFVDYRAALIAFGILVVVLLTFHYMSLASMTGAITFPLALFVLSCDCKVIVLALCSAILIILRHSSNIKRLIHKEENKFYLKSK